MQSVFLDRHSCSGSRKKLNSKCSQFCLVVNFCLIMGIIFIFGILGLTALLRLILKYPRETLIVIRQFPRDAAAVYRFVQITVFSLYCKKKNLTASKYFDEVVKKRGMSTCFLYEDEIWTFKRVQEESLRVAKYFQDAGYKKGDVVGLFMENRPEYVCIWLGLGRLGVVTSLINTNLRLDALNHCINTSTCKGLVFGTELTSAVQGLADSGGNKTHMQLYSMEDRTPPKESLTCNNINLSHALTNMGKIELDQDFGPVYSNDTAFYIFTSGTTGMPKAAKMKYSRVFTYGSVGLALGMNPTTDVLLTPIPLYHVQGGMIGVAFAIFHGVPQVIVRKFSASNFWKQCIKYDVTHCQYLGEIIRYLYNQPEKPEDNHHKVHSFLGNGANPVIWEKFVKRFNVKLLEMYGSTEGNCSTVNMVGHVGAIGYLPNLLYPILPIFVARVDLISGELIRNAKTGLLQHVGLGEAGELLGKISDSNPFREFNGYTDETATKQKIVENVKKAKDQWFRTGDLVTKDEDGYFYFKDRTGETYKWKGENVSTVEVEQVITKASDDKAVTVYGVQVPGADGKCGMAAIFDPNGELSLKKLTYAINKHLPHYARPVFLRITKDTLQMTGTFKLQKLSLQKTGFDPVGTADDCLFILQKEEYIPLDSKLYQDIVEGKLRL